MKIIKKWNCYKKKLKSKSKSKSKQKTNQILPFFHICPTSAANRSASAITRCRGALRQPPIVSSKRCRDKASSSSRYQIIQQQINFEKVKLK